MRPKLLFAILAAMLVSVTCFAQASQPPAADETQQSYPIPPQGFDQVRDGIERGDLERVEYSSTTAGATRWMQVYTPPGYSSENKYPVFYLLHGAGQDERAWIQGGQANVILDNLIADKKIVPMIVVFPNTNVSVPAARGAAAGGASAGRGARGRGGFGGGFGNFTSELLEDIIPYIESHYSVYADGQHRALAGLSMGGMQTKAIAPEHSDTFAYFGVFSGGNISPTEDITDIATFRRNVKLVYMSFGSREPSNPRGSAGLPSGPVGIKRESEALNKIGVKAVYYVSPNSAHDFTSWKRSLYYFTSLLFTDSPLASSTPTAMASSSVDSSHRLKNAPVPSAGCGKDLGDFKSGVYTIESAGLTRQYTIDIPDNYDKNTPHRLIFAMHMMGGHMNTMVNNNFYELKTYAQRDNVPVIFVAPEGYTDRSPWRGSDDKDHIFFADMLALFKDKLSIDTSRIFCCGFSFGAMVSYSLSLDFQDDLRAVACYAPANWNIYLPENKHKPLAFYSTTGTNDGLCRWINSDERRQGGKYCVLTHLEDNGLTELPEIPLATGPTHVTTEFEGLPEEYPVVFGSFVGDHTDNARDPGSDVNWIAKETWEFFMRF